jgi:ribonuclease Z
MKFRFLILAVLMMAVVFAPSANAKSDADFQVVLLGTGTPPPLAFRFGPATLVIAGKKRILFDAGRGVTIRLWQDKIRLGSIDYLVLTHLHSDHVVGIPDLWLTGWLNSPFSRRKGNFKVRGPEGTVSMMNGLRKAYDWDIQTRMADQKLPLANVTIDAKDHGANQVVLDEDGVKVTSIQVNHGAKIKPAYGYRIDYDGRSVVLSGDTKYNENLANKAKGADLFIHHVAAAKPALLKTKKFWKVILAHHTSPEDVGKVFSIAKPKMAAFTHLVLLTNGKIKPPSFPDLIKRTRTTYSGPLVVGKDRMRFIVGKDGVKVVQPPMGKKKMKK